MKSEEEHDAILRSLVERATFSPGMAEVSEQEIREVIEYEMAPLCWCGHTEAEHGPKDLVGSDGTRYPREDACLKCTNQICDEFEPI